MSGPKIVILVLIVLVVIFVMTVGVGAWAGGDLKYDPNSRWVEMLKAAFPPKALDQKRIVSTCFRAGVFTIPANQPTCDVHIREGKPLIRGLKLKLLKGEAKLSYKPSQKDGQKDRKALPIEDRKLKQDESLTLQISEKGGTLTLTNVGFPSQPCQIGIIE